MFILRGILKESLTLKNDKIFLNIKIVLKKHTFVIFSDLQSKFFPLRIILKILKHLTLLLLLYSTPPLSHKNGNAFQPQIANKKNGSECRRSTRTRTKDEKSTGCGWMDGWLVAGGKEDTNTLFTISIHKSFLNTWQRQVDFLVLFFYGVFSSICFKTITFFRIIFFYYFFIILKSKCDKHWFYATDKKILGL